MDVKKIAFALTVAALALPVVAAAAPPAGKGKPPAAGETCKPRVTVLVKGVATSDPEAGAASFTMDVKRANRHGKQLVADPATSLTVNADLTAPGTTKVRRSGKQSNLDTLECGRPACSSSSDCARPTSPAMPRATRPHSKQRPPFVWSRTRRAQSSNSPARQPKAPPWRRGPSACSTSHGSSGLLALRQSRQRNDRARRGRRRGRRRS